MNTHATRKQKPRNVTAEPQNAIETAQTETPQPKPPARLMLRPATAGDLTPLSFFFDTMLRDDYFMRRGQLEELLSGKHHQVYVAEIDAVLVGIAVTTKRTRLVNVLVHPSYRGIGIGQALVERTGATEVRAKLDMSTGDPRAFYRRLGFRSTKQRNDKGNIELMRRRITAAPSPDTHNETTPTRTVTRGKKAR